MGKSASTKPTSNAARSTAHDTRVATARNHIPEANDPYIPGGHYRDDTVCSECGAVYAKQRWSFNDERSELLVSAGVANSVICPGCRILEAHDPQGVVTLKGEYWPNHRDDILNLIRNEEQRGMGVNPLERIMDIREEGGCLIVETTTEKLAQRVGRSIGRAHKGHLNYHWSDGNQLVRVYWER